MELLWFLVSLTVINSVSCHLGLRHLKRRQSTSGGLADKWVDQKLDHFDQKNTKIWKQRYEERDDYFTNPDGPVFLWIDGEVSLDEEWETSATASYARHYNALCIGLEHRFYGRSQPTGDLSVDSLRYLSTEQALADAAHFVSWMIEHRNLTNNKWVAIGGSYSGNLVAWARLKYPHLIHAAVSDSAPVLAKVNFKGYVEVVRNALASSSASCPKNVHRATLAVHEKLKDPSAVEEFHSKFKLCSKLNPINKLDVETFIFSVARDVMGTVQYNGKGNVTKLCRIMDNDKEDYVDRYAQVVKMEVDQLGETCTQDSYVKHIHSLMNISTLTDVAFMRSWTYQTCTELGYFQTSSSQQDLFGPFFDLDYRVNQCRDIFGEGFDLKRVQAGVKRTNENYGGLGIVDNVTNVVFVQGSLDPWHVLGVCQSTNPRAPAIVIDGASHCPLESAPSSPQADRAREEVDRLLGQWLTQS